MIRLRECRLRIVTFTIDMLEITPSLCELDGSMMSDFRSQSGSSKLEFREERVGKYVLALYADFVAKNWLFRHEDGVIFKPATLERSLRYIREDQSNEGSVREYVGERSRIYGCMLINTVTWKAITGFDPSTDGYECPNLDFRNHRFSFPRDFDTWERPFRIEVL